VDGLAISSQSPFRVVGKNFPVANQGRVLVPRLGLYQFRCSEKAVSEKFGKPGGGSGRLGRCIGVGSLCDHLCYQTLEPL